MTSLKIKQLHLQKKSVIIRKRLIKHHFFTVYMHNTTKNAIFVQYETTEVFLLAYEKRIWQMVNGYSQIYGYGTFTVFNLWKYE